MYALIFLAVSAFGAGAIPKCEVLHLVADGTPPAQIITLEDVIRRVRPGCVIERHTLGSLAQMREQDGTFDVIIVHGFESPNLDARSFAAPRRPKLKADGALILGLTGRTPSEMTVGVLESLNAPSARALIITRTKALIPTTELLKRSWDFSLAQVLVAADAFGLLTLKGSQDLHPQLVLYPLAALAGLKALHAVIGPQRYGAVFNSRAANHLLGQIALSFGAGELALLVLHGDPVFTASGAVAGLTIVGLGHARDAWLLRRECGRGLLVRTTATGDIETTETNLTNALTCQNDLEAS